MSPDLGKDLGDELALDDEVDEEGGGALVVQVALDVVQGQLRAHDELHVRPAPRVERGHLGRGGVRGGGSEEVVGARADLHGRKRELGEVADEQADAEGVALVPVLRVDGHHLAQGLEDLDAERVLLLLHQLRSVGDESPGDAMSLVWILHMGIILDS